MASWKVAGLLLMLATCVQVAKGEEEDEDSDFSFSALFIGFREALEACVIISVMLNMLDKTDNKHLKKWVWIGSFSGLLVSCIVGGGMVGAYYAVKEQVMSANDMYIFEGVFSGIASIFLTFLGIGFLRFADLEKKWSEKLFKRDGVQMPEAEGVVGKLKQKYGIQSQAISESAFVAGKNFGGEVVDESSDDSSSVDDAGVNYKTIVALTFSAVFREGLETFLFLGAVGSNAKPSGLALGGLVGIVLGILFGFAVLWIGRYIKSIMWFFVATTTFILFIGAGLAGYSAHEFEELGKPHSYKTNAPIIMRPMWDISECCPDSSGPGAVFRAIAGYQDKPTLIECLVYLAYWIFVLTLMTWRYKNGVLFSRRKKGGTLPSPSSASITGDDAKVKSLTLDTGAKISSDFVHSGETAPIISSQPLPGLFFNPALPNGMMLPPASFENSYGYGPAGGFPQPGFQPGYQPGVPAGMPGSGMYPVYQPQALMHGMA